MWHHFVNLAGRAWGNMTAATSTNTLGFILWIIAIALTAFAGTLGGTWFKHQLAKEPRPFRKALNESLWPGAFELLALAVLVAVAWGSFITKTVYDEHMSMTAALARLQGFASEKQQLEDQVRAAKADAELWRSNYTNFQHGDIHPDRFLNNEQTNKLFIALERLAKDSRNKDYIRNLFVACDCGGEPCQLARQILKTFQEAHWQATGMSMEKLKQITSRQLMPFGIVLFSDDGSKGGFLSFILKDAGLELGPDEYFVKLPPDPKNKTVRTIIWIGAKQRWQ
jgi:hypothetical protein